MQANLATEVVPYQRALSHRIDFTHRWYTSIRSTAIEISAGINWLSSLNQYSAALHLTNHLHHPIRFVPQDELPGGTAYETYISQTGHVPTRDNLHDFFNALVWLSMPNIKRQLNAVQATQIECHGIGQTRGGVRDATTLFDENALLLAARDHEAGHSLVNALRNRQWHNALWERRSAFIEHVEVWAFGHALMEKLITPYKGITAHAWVVTVPNHYFSLPDAAKRHWLDIHVAAELAHSALTTQCFTPLPVLGIPGWWPNQDAAFYADANVFRPKRL